MSTDWVVSWPRLWSLLGNRTGFVHQVGLSVDLLDAYMLTGPDNSRLIADRIDNAELLVVPGANHSVHVEKTDLVISKIREFLEL